EQPGPRLESGGTGARARRERRRCGHRRQRRAGGGRADERRHRRRPLRHRLRGEDRKAPRSERERLGARRDDARLPPWPRAHGDAPGWHPDRHRSGMRGRLGRDAAPVREASLPDAPRLGHPLRAGGVPGHRTNLHCLEVPRVTPERRLRAPENLPPGRTGPAGALPAGGRRGSRRDLGAALRRPPRRGRAGSYRGPTATAILEVSRRLGGALEPADLTELQAEWVDPISTTYRGWKISELPPN